MAIAVLASNSLLGGALNVPVGEVYPEPPPPPGIAIIATLPPCSRETKKVVIPDDGDMLVVTPGDAVYNVPGLVTVTVPIAPSVARTAVALATRSGFDRVAALYEPGVYPEPSFVIVIPVVSLRDFLLTPKFLLEKIPKEEKPACA